MCRGHRTDGAPCRAFAVNGAEVCSVHGGSAPQVLRKAAVRQIEAKVVGLADKYARDAGPVSDPLRALMDIAGEISGFKDFIGERVAELRSESWRYEGTSSEQVRAEVALYERAMDRTVRVLVDIAKLNLEERMVKLTEQQGEVIFRVMSRVFDRIGLTAEQNAEARRVAAEELRSIVASNAAEAEQGAAR